MRKPPTRRDWFWPLDRVMSENDMTQTEIAAAMATQGFPQPINISGQPRLWLASEVKRWRAQQIEAAA